jgi:hypothetical protein
MSQEEGRNSRGSFVGVDESGRVRIDEIVSLGARTLESPALLHHYENIFLVDSALASI